MKAPMPERPVTPSEMGMLLLACAFGGFVGIIWIEFASIGPSACSDVPASQCTREWIGALSGWFSGVVTLITLVYIAKQVKALNIPFIQMRINDLFQEQTIAEKVIYDIDINRVDNDYDSISSAIVDFIKTGMTEDQSFVARRKLELSFHIFQKSTQIMLGCSAFGEPPKVFEARGKTINDTINIQQRLTVLTEAVGIINKDKWNEQFSEKIFEEMKDVLILMGSAQNNALYWHAEISAALRERREIIDKIIERT